MSSSVPVHVHGLGGNELTLQMKASDTVQALKDEVSAAWSVSAHAFRLLLGAAVLEDAVVLESLAPGEGSPVEVQLVKFDPLLDLGQFAKAAHQGIEVRSLDGKLPRTALVKTHNAPDSNNVLLRRLIREPCFVEFQVVRSRDEMSFGVTTNSRASMVEKSSGFTNLGLISTWLYSKRKQMPAFLFAGASRLYDGVDEAGFSEGDCVAVHVDPQERCVKFYKNGELVGSNLPDHPLPPAGEDEGSALRMYAMVDFKEDEVEVTRFGPGEPYHHHQLHPQAVPEPTTSTPVPVHVHGLGGSELTLQMQASDTVERLKGEVSAAWSVSAHAFRLLLGAAVLEDAVLLESLVPEEGSPVQVQLVKFDPLLDLGQFEKATHRGIEVVSLDGKLPRTALVKTHRIPDSNNVFVRRLIREPCFVEFKVVRSRDEMSFGVTSNGSAVEVERSSGFANMRLKSTWLYSKRAQMPVFLFAGTSQLYEGVDKASFSEGDCVAVHVDPQERCVKFYKNGELVGSNLPDHPLPPAGEDEGRALRMWAMVDEQQDEVEVMRFGPGKPYK